MPPCFSQMTPLTYGLNTSVSCRRGGKGYGTLCGFVAQGASRMRNQVSPTKDHHSPPVCLKEPSTQQIGVPSDWQALVAGSKIFVHAVDLKKLVEPCPSRTFEPQSGFALLVDFTRSSPCWPFFRDLVVGTRIVSYSATGVDPKKIRHIQTVFWIRPLSLNT